jgi:hypothetical protein
VLSAASTMELGCGQNAMNLRVNLAAVVEILSTRASVAATYSPSQFLLSLFVFCPDAKAIPGTLRALLACIQTTARALA